eukprot:sb/3467045/
MGRIDVPQRRRISFLPEPPTITEDQARYIRLPTKEEIIEEERVPRVTYEDQLEHVEGHERRRKSLTNLPQYLSPERKGNLRRRGSRSMGEVEMKKYLPFIGRSPSPVHGLDREFTEKLTLFNGQLYNLKRRDSFQTIPQTEVDRTAPPPRDIFGEITDPLVVNRMKMEGESPITEERGDTVEGGETPKKRLSTVDRFNLSTWRKPIFPAPKMFNLPDMALSDTIPNIRSCKYIRTPGKERWDPLTKQWYDHESSDDEDAPEISSTTGEERVEYQEQQQQKEHQRRISKREPDFLRVVRVALMNRDILENQES